MTDYDGLFLFTLWQWIGLISTLLFFLPALLGLFIFRQSPVVVIHQSSGMTKIARLGWSWTYWYFGFLVPVSRGEILIGALHLFITLFTFGLFQLIMSFLYNRQHLVRLLESGWALAGNEEYAREKLGIETKSVYNEPSLRK